MTKSLRVPAVALLAAASLPVLSAAPASAVVVTVAGNAFDIAVLQTSYDANSSLFQAMPSGKMPWWGDDLLASEFAAEIYSLLGPGWDSDYGPVFAFDLSGGFVSGLVQSLTDPLDQINVTAPSSASIRYAVSATAQTPGPLPLFGAAAAFGWSRQLRRRIGDR